MFRSYLTVAWRSLLKRPGFSLINILGLASGLAICMLIVTLIRDQSSYDRFHPLGDRIYRVVSDRTSSSSSSFATTPPVLYEELVGAYPAIERAVRIRGGLGVDAVYGEETLPLRGLWTEPAFFELFHFPLAYGDAGRALEQPNSIVLTQELVRRLGVEPAALLGQTVELGDWGPFTVTGVLDELPGKTHLQFELLASYATVPGLERAEQLHVASGRWDDTNDTYLYLLLREGADARDLAAAFPGISDARYADFENYRLDFRLQALPEITPSEMLENDMLFTVPKVALYFLSLLALIVMLTACFNYTNLSVAKALTRVREIGVRKVTGARRSQIFAQFITESVLVALLALIVGYILFEVVMVPLFRGLFFNRYFEIDLYVGSGLLAVFILLAVAVGLVAGLLPAAYLSAFRPVRILRPVSDLKVFARLGWRKLLIALQFVVSLVFITTVVVLYDQTEFMLNADYGFDRENVINLSLQGQDYQKLKQELLRNPAVKAVSGCSVLPASGANQGTSIRRPDDEEPLGSHQIIVDAPFFDNMQLDMAAGRSLQEEGAGDEVVVNETAARRLGWAIPAEAIGQPLMINTYDDGGAETRIVGVVKDFFYLGMERPIDNLILYYDPTRLRYANLRVQTSDMRGVLSFLETTWKDLDPVHPVDYRFYDDTIAMIVGVYQDLMKILGFLALVAIVITSLGILGVATYSVETRTKEVGIRKVLGAGVSHIIWTLSRGLLAPVALALLVALPLSWLLNRLWLQEIAYHVDLNGFNLGAGLLLLVVLSAAMVGSQAYRLAVRNPVETLRDE